MRAESFWAGTAGSSSGSSSSSGTHILRRRRRARSGSGKRRRGTLLGMSHPPSDACFGSFSIAPAGRSQLRSSYFSFSPPHPLKFGDGTVAERRQFPPLSVTLPRSRRVSPGSEMLPSLSSPGALPPRRHCRGDPPDPAASAGAPRFPPPRTGCCLALGVSCFPPPRPSLVYPVAGEAGGKDWDGGRTLPHHPSGVRRRRGAAGRHCRGCGGWRCGTSPSRSSPFPLILPPPQPGLRFLLPDPQILAD